MPWRIERLGLVFCLAFPGVAAAQQGPWDSVAAILGRAGAVGAGVYRVNFPRSDLRVVAGSVAVEPALALTSWAAFAPQGDSTAVAGDLVLAEAEVDPVVQALLWDGFQVMAIHHHLLHESPRVLYVHYMGSGKATELARGLRRVLDRTATPGAMPAASIPASAPDTAQIFTALGVRGRLNGSVVGIGVPTSGSAVTVSGWAVPSGMGMNTAINLQPAGAGRLAATGDFVLTAAKVAAVQRALVDAGIEVTSLHNHMLDEEPRAFFMHFWGAGPAERILSALRQGLDAAR